MSDTNIMRRIANNHQIKFIIEPLSYDSIGGVKITLVKENEDGSKSCISRITSRYNRFGFDALDKSDKTFIMTMINMLDEAEKEEV